jgi:hypothetical protein
MTKKELFELIKKTLQEYTGTGASGGNAGDGNNITAPGIPYDDDEAVERYTNKSIYGGDGGHYKKYVKTNNYNSLNHQGMYEEDIEADDYGSATLTTQGQMSSNFTLTGKPPGIWEKKKQSLNEGLAEDQAEEKQKHEEDGITMEMRHATERYQEAMQQHGDSGAALKKQLQKELDQLKQRLQKIKTGGGKTPGAGGGGAPGGGPPPGGAPGGGGGGPTMQEQKNKNQKNISDMNLIKILENEKSNIKDDIRYNLRRSSLMENTMKTFFNKFEGGMTNEEIVQDYALQGTQVPENLVGKFRKQWEEYTKLKLELEMSEKEFKNSAKEIVNNPEEDTTGEEDPKQLASGLFKEEILKKQIRKELKKIKIK